MVLPPPPSPDAGAPQSDAGTPDSDAPLPTLSLGRLKVYEAQFAVLNRLLAPDHGVLFFMCCLTAQLQAGTDFLCAVSKLLPDRDIMAMSTIGYSLASAMTRGGSGLGEPGMRDTEYVWRRPLQRWKTSATPTLGGISARFPGRAGPRRTRRSRATVASSAVRARACSSAPARRPAPMDGE
jgi:hypothetical protein